MRHQNAFRKFQKSPAHRRALFRNMATSLFREERFETTVQKAKELRRVVEKLITVAKKDTLPARRQLYSYIMDKAVVHKLFAEIGPRFKTRPGGYTRVVRSGWRHGDSAEMAFIELVPEEYKAKQKTKKRGGKAGAKADSGEAAAAEKSA